MMKLIKGIGAALLISASLVGTANAALMNVALGGSASQSTTGFGGLASRAIDGNTSGEWGDGSVSHTARGDNNPWWEVDLGSGFQIESINIWNRTDCCADRLNPFTVAVFDYSHVLIASLPWASTPSPSQLFAVPTNIALTQFVRISQSLTDHPDINQRFLQLAEVQVFANVPTPATLALFGLGLVGLGWSRRKKA